MQHLSLATLVATGSLLAGQAFAEDLTGNALKKEISGKRVFLSTPYGGEMPLMYSANGSVTGDVSGFRLASMFAPRETGKWWVDGDQLCQQWPTWYDGKTSCFTLRRTGPGALNWVRDDGLKGTARVDG